MRAYFCDGVLNKRPVRRENLSAAAALCPGGASVETSVSVPIARPQAENAEPDARLMALVRRGDRDAFACLVDRHKEGLVAYLARLTGSPDRAQDLAQEAFLRLLRSAGSYREQGHLTAFLYRIATNLVRSEARRERRWRLLAPELAQPAKEPAAPAGPRRLLRQELQDRLAAAVARLPLPLRAVVVLYEIEEWSQRDIARALGCREGTVKSRLHRARARLREELAAYWDGWNGGLS
jgi:RNA polymerase sigma-70 factor (ECF subfamily)